MTPLHLALLKMAVAGYHLTFRAGYGWICYSPKGDSEIADTVEAAVEKAVGDRVTTTMHVQPKQQKQPQETDAQIVEQFLRSLN